MTRARKAAKKPVKSASYDAKAVTQTAPEPPAKKVRGKSRDYDVVDVIVSSCRTCGSTDRSKYEKPNEIEAVGEIDGRAYNVVILRRCQCTRCGQWRIDRSYEFRANDGPESSNGGNTED